MRILLVGCDHAKLSLLNRFLSANGLEIVISNTHEKQHISLDKTNENNIIFILNFVDILDAHVYRLVKPFREKKEWNEVSIILLKKGDISIINKLCKLEFCIKKIKS